jgi:hypothetical protein
MGANNTIEQYHNTDWSTIHPLKIENNQINSFFDDFQRNLKKSGWIHNRSINNSNENLPIQNNKDLTKIETYEKGSWQLLTLGKLLGLFTCFMFLIASGFRIILPIGNEIPLFIFIVGAILTIVLILNYVYKFEKAVSDYDDIVIAFIESLIKFEE